MYSENITLYLSAFCEILEHDVSFLGAASEMNWEKKLMNGEKKS